MYAGINHDDASYDEFAWETSIASRASAHASVEAPSQAIRDAGVTEAKINAIASEAMETTEQLHYRQEKIIAARNPLYQAAKPLLRTLADLPDTHFDSRIRIETFRRIIQCEVSNFEMLCTRANIDPKHVKTASYCLCTAIDEAANSTPWGGGTNGELGPWASGMLAQSQHSDSEGGRKFFLLIGRLSTAQPEQHCDLLEVMYHILCLGFQGQYRSDPDGPRHLVAIRKHLDTLITAGREPIPSALSPHLQGVAPDRFQAFRSIPVRVSATVMTLVVLVTCGYYKYQLVEMTNKVVDNIVAISAMSAPPATPSPTR